MSPNPKFLAKAALRSAPTTRVVRFATSRWFRVAAYHGVPDAAAFARHVDYYRTEWNPVSGSQVADALAGGVPLPPKAVWITFDDGESSVVRNGLPALKDAGVPATMFICPGLVEGRQPFWWDVIARAAQLGDLPRSVVVENPIEYLKAQPDTTRREMLSELGEHVTDELVARVADEQQLGSWVDAGLELGNHSWDHPMLDQCSADDQRDQITTTDSWLSERGWNVKQFAFPNGNRESATGAVGALDSLGYRLCVLHDHKLSSTTSDPSKLSRLKTEADDPIDRLDSIISGAQPLLRRLADHASTLRS